MSGGHDDAHGHAAHPEGDDEAHGAGGHGEDPNAGVVLGTPPTPAWVLTAVGIGLVTAIVVVILAFALPDSPALPGDGDHGGGQATTPTAPAEGH